MANVPETPGRRLKTARDPHASLFLLSEPSGEQHISLVLGLDARFGSWQFLPLPCALGILLSPGPGHHVLSHHLIHWIVAVKP